MARKRNKLLDKHIKLARSTKYEDSESFFDGKSADQLIEEAYKTIRSYRYRVVRSKLIKPTVTMPITIYLGKDFSKYSKPTQAAILWHEIVHARQWRDSKAIFPLRYPLRKWQWSFETHGYRQQCRVIRALYGDDRARDCALAVPSGMMKRPYTMRRLDAKQVRLETLRAFECGLPGLKLL